MRQALDLSTNEVGGAVMHLARVINSGVCPELRLLRLAGNVYEMDVIINLFTARTRRRLKVQ
jgi:hypothetical protein